MAMMTFNLRPTVRQLRQFGAAGFVAMGLLGALARSHPAMYAFWLVAFALGLIVLVAPRSLWAVYIAMLVITWPIGQVVSYFVLALLFYGVFTPIGLVMRLIGRDAMNRRFDRGAASYWVRRPTVTDAKRYFQQF